MSKHSNADKAAYMSLGLVTGAAAGMLAGVLTAPRAGDETRARIRTKTIHERNRIKQQLSIKRNKATDKINKTIDMPMDMADTAANKAKSLVDKTANRAKEAANRAKAEVNSPNLDKS